MSTNQEKIGRKAQVYSKRLVSELGVTLASPLEDREMTNWTTTQGTIKGLNDPENINHFFC